MKRNSRRASVPPRLRSWVALTMVPSLGARRCQPLLKRYPDPAQIFAASERELISLRGIGTFTAQQILSFDRWDEVDAVLENTRRYGAALIARNDPRYPPLLGEIFDSPLLLWVLGDAGILSMPGIAVVGTRRPGKYGIQQAKRFGTGLVRRGFAVVSGLAYGIDAAAHRAAVDGGGKTVAVLGSGIDRLYPPKNRKLARDIIRSGGAVISEYPPGTRPRPHHFPVRNRIVSGMTLGTLVIESGREGGSMITATSALDQNREVFAIPHAVDSGSGAGNGLLIREGMAGLVMGIEDLVEDLPPYAVPSPPASPDSRFAWRGEDLDELSREICRLLEAAPRHIDELSLRLKTPSPRLLARLLDLEMERIVYQKAGKVFEISR